MPVCQQSALTKWIKHPAHEDYGMRAVGAGCGLSCGICGTPAESADELGEVAAASEVEAPRPRSQSDMALRCSDAMVSVHPIPQCAQAGSGD